MYSSISFGMQASIHPKPLAKMQKLPSSQKVSSRLFPIDPPIPPPLHTKAATILVYHHGFVLPLLEYHLNVII